MKVWLEKKERTADYSSDEIDKKNIKVSIPFYGLEGEPEESFYK